MDRTNARRQAQYRERMSSDDGERFRRLNYWISREAFDALTALATRSGKPKRMELDRIIIDHEKKSRSV